MSFAISYTVKNEAGLLPDAIAYHLAIGCSRIYVFFDGTTDNSRELISHIQQVTCAECVEPTALQAPPAWIARILPGWATNMDVRKRINTFHAAELARREGIEWLISIDADELLLLSASVENTIGSSEQYFDSIPNDVDQILLPNLEAVPLGEGSGRPFADCTSFLRRFPATELIWRYSSGLLRRTLRNPKIHAWYDYWFYYLRFRGALPRLMRHPITRESIPAGYFLGYSNHKSFIRTRVAKQFVFNVHEWQKTHRHPRTVRRGYVLHYDLCSAEYFQEKFRQRHPSMMVKAFFFRFSIGEIARELPFNEVRYFFLNYLCIRNKKVIQRLRRQNIVIDIEHIAKWMDRREPLLRDQPQNRV